MKTLAETVEVVRRLLRGDSVTTHGEQINLHRVQMQLIPREVPPIYIGAMREKSLRLAGNLGDGTILTGMSSPAYVSWARERIQAGMAEAGRSQNRIAVYYDVKVNPDGNAARAAARQSLTSRLPWADIQLQTLGIEKDVDAFLQKHGVEDMIQHMPDEWLDAFSASGTPEQVAQTIQRMYAAGTDTLIFQPLDADPDCLDEYIRYLMPLLKTS